MQSLQMHGNKEDEPRYCIAVSEPSRRIKAGAGGAQFPRVRLTCIRVRSTAKAVYQSVKSMHYRSGGGGTVKKKRRRQRLSRQSSLPLN